MVGGWPVMLRDDRTMHGVDCLSVLVVLVFSSLDSLQSFCVGMTVTSRSLQSQVSLARVVAMGCYYPFY